jgi:hypothetical protein
MCRCNNCASCALLLVVNSERPFGWLARCSALLHAVLSCCTLFLHVCRCGLDIPESSATNASVSGIRVWCAEPLLAAAAARLAAAATDAGVCPASPELMHHLRTGLQEELSNPRGTINKQVGPALHLSLLAFVCRAQLMHHPKTGLQER